MSNPDIQTIRIELEQAYSTRIAPERLISLSNGQSDQDVKDSTLKFLAPTPSGRDGFLIISANANPDLVERAAQNISDARDQLSSAAPNILAPVATGRIEGRSFAVWDRHEDLISGNRFVWAFRRRTYARRILDWISNVCSESLAPVPDAAGRAAGFVSPLETIAGDLEFSPEIRKHARLGIAHLDSGDWAPRHCLQHGDFWAANVLRDSDDTAPGGIYVIDWAGMNARGYPVYDLARMLLSLKCGSRSTMVRLAKFGERLSCRPVDLTSYALCALGSIGSNLEYFPVEKYRIMSETVFAFLKSHEA